MNIEDLLRETLSDMAQEEQPPPPGRFLRVNGGRSRRRGLALAAAATVAVMAVGSTLVVEGLSSRVLVAGDSAGQGSGEVLAGPGKDFTGQGSGEVVVVIEQGLRLSDILKQLSKVTEKPLKEFERAARDGRALGLPAYAKGSLEGFILPSNYEIVPSSSPGEILAEMVARSNRLAEDIDLVDGARRVGRTPLEILTIASIIQAESGRKLDMPKISRVIHNRLNHKPAMRLQVDSTVMYGLNKYGISASLEDLKSRSPYNTYARLGLPPGPICNPGYDAIKAALKPATGPWLWFVTTDPKKGVTKFAGSESEFFKLKEESHRNRRTG
jgi:peptidoglycan lytic transglycosylase G